MQDISNIEQLQLNDLPNMEKRVRDAWVEGDEVEIFSNADKQWHAGRVVRIFKDAEGEWLQCEYVRSKQMQRHSTDVRPVNRPQKPLYSSRKVSNTKSTNMDAAAIRQMMTDYENKRPNEEQKSEPECTLALIKPDAFTRGYIIIWRLLQIGFRVLDMKQVRLTKTRAKALYAEHKGKAFFEELIAFMTSGPMYALKLEKRNAIKDLLEFVGPNNIEKAKKEHPQSVRAKFATSMIRNAAHGSCTAKAAARELDLFFNCEQTLALIKPDAVAAGKADEIEKLIESVGFTVVESARMTLTKERAEEFYAEHKGKDYFDELIAFMASGELVALKLEKKNAIRAWRVLMGPADFKVAQKQNPRSIRALYGSSTSMNAVHGSDSIRSAARGLAFFFPQQETVAWIKPEALSGRGAARRRNEIMQRIVDEGFTLLQTSAMNSTPTNIQRFATHPQFMLLGRSLVLKLRATNAVAKLRTLMNYDSADVGNENEQSPELIKNHKYVYCSDSTTTAQRDLRLLYPTKAVYFSAKQYTLALIKPDVVARGKAQEIIDRIVYEGFVIREQVKLKLNKERAAEFYIRHKKRDFFDELIGYLTSGEIIALKLERECAIQKWRDLMGSADVEEAKARSPQSVRAMYATSLIRNAVHGSDFSHAARTELEFFFDGECE